MAMAPTRSRMFRATAGCMSGSSWMVRSRGCMSIPRRRQRSLSRGWWRRAARASGVWAGAFGRGAYFSNIRYTAAPGSSAETPAPAPPSGTMLGWEISSTVEAADFTPAALPDLARLTWQPVEAEPEGFVLINRYREAPVGGVPRDSTGAVLIDSVMTGKIAGSRIVYARTTITAAHDETRRMQYAYSNGVVIYLNGRPLAFAMNPGGLRSNLGVMAKAGDAVYLPLRRGRNQIIFAVIECTGGWAFSARLDPGVK